MEKRFGARLEVETHYGIIKNLKTIFGSIAGIRLGIFQDKISIDMFASSYLPYEASKTYREIMIGFDCARAKAMIEARRQTFCGT